MPLPFLTAGGPSGGHFKETPDDFEVEEIPAYQPNGEGEHLFLWVEKRGVATPDAANRLARQLDTKERDVSWAGLKDKQAVTRQFFSMPARGAEGLVPSFADPEVKVLWAKRHKNKLKNGHLHGNRFRIKLSSVADVGAAKASFDELITRGLPNFFGEQRFGATNTNAERGKRVLLAGNSRGGFERKLLLSAYQSSLFNRLLSDRVTAGTFDRALLGDVLKKHQTGGEFVCADVAVDQPRVDAFEVSAAGPMFGPEMTASEAGVAEAEKAVLTAEGVSLETFENGGGETRGARRHYRVQLENPTFEPAGPDVWLSFGLPSGSYATEVLRELLKK